MSVDRREALLGEIRALYARISGQRLRPGDRVDLALRPLPDHRPYMRHALADRVAFEQNLGAFADTYDVFRMFGPDDVVLDVGADWGYSALAMRSRGCSARILSIEAMPHNALALAELAATDAGYGFVECAASDDPGELTLHLPVINGHVISGLASTGRTFTDYFAGFLADLAESYPRPAGPDVVQAVRVVVRARRIDEVTRTLGLFDRVAAVKMDIEGHEPSALRGARALFEARRPLLMVEAANRDPDVVTFMAGLGYFHAERREGRLVRHDAPSMDQDGFWIHPDRAEAYRAWGVLA